MADWKSLTFGVYSMKEILEAIDDSAWQKFRKEKLKGESSEKKFALLKFWINTHGSSRKAKIQVTNYVNALRRGGLVSKKPE